MPRRIASIGLLLAIVLAGCASPAAPSSGARPAQDAPSRPPAPKRIVAAMTGDPHVLLNKLNTNSAVRGIDALEKLVVGGLVQEDDQERLRPQLAEAVPSLENGLWRVFPDGSMETTWKIRSGARWHDGTPLTTDDLLFTMQVVRDRELPVFGHIAFGGLDVVEAVDSQTVRARWTRPFIDADRMFAIGTSSFAHVLPKHLLETAYETNKAGFIELPYWSVNYVGTGPFKLRDWVSGSHLVLEAFDGFVSGRPKLDQVEVRFILDSNTLVANVLANEIDLTLGRGISIEQALQVKGVWQNGRVDTGSLRSAINLWPQLLNPTPALLTDVRFRRAMVHAIDRQALVDTLQGGLTSVVHSWLKPNEPEYRQLEPNIIRYDYDLRRATQLLEELGHTRGADGIYRDREGERLGLEFRTITADVNQKTLLAISDYWQRAGVAVDQVVVPTQRQSDLPYRSTFPAYDLLRGNTSIENFNNLHSTGARLPENNFRGGGSGGVNYNRYVNPQFDSQIERFYTTIARPDRMRIAADLIQHMTDQVLVTGVFYDLSPAFVSTRLRGVTTMGGDQSLPWNAHEWDL